MTTEDGRGLPTLAIENWILARPIQSAAKIPMAIRRRAFDASIYRLA
jgi:hypothetical protein